MAKSLLSRDTLTARNDGGKGVRNEHFPKDLPSDVAERLDGFLDDAEGLESFKHPGLDDLIANLVEGVESWEGDLGRKRRGHHGARRALGCSLQAGVDCDPGEAHRKPIDRLSGKPT